MMSNAAVQVQLQHLPHLYTTIQKHHLHGRLTWQHDDDHVHLFFQNGLIVHAQVDPHGQTGEDALDWLLTHQGGGFRWVAASEDYNPTTSMSRDMADNFDRLLWIMVESELLQRPSATDFDLRFFGVEAPVPEAPPAAPPPPSSLPRLLFPPADHDENLTRTLAATPVSEHLAMLQKLKWTGYVYYQPAGGGEALILGVVVIESGVATAAQAQDLATNTAWSGATAWQQLAEHAQRAEAFRVQPRILAAFRAVLQPDQATPEPLTKTALQHGLVQFRQTAANGAMTFRGADNAELFLLFERGQPLGLYGVAGSANTLTVMPPNHPLPLGDPAATLRMLIAPPPNDLAAPQPVALSAANYQLLINSLETMLKLAIQIVGPTAGQQAFITSVQHCIRVEGLPTVWNTVVRPTTPALRWPATSTTFGNAAQVIAGFEALIGCVYQHLHTLIGPAFQPMLQRAWGASLDQLHQIPLRIPFATDAPLTLDTELDAPEPAESSRDDFSSLEHDNPFAF